MPNKVYVNGQSILLDPSQTIGKGGEADIYAVSVPTLGMRAVKVYKPPDHPDLVGQPLEQRIAKRRIEEHQGKLKAFPKNLPPRVIVPLELVTDKTGQKIVGYTMRHLTDVEVLMRYGERNFREAGVSNETVVAIFKDLHQTVSGIHQAGVVIGDFNDLNELVRGVETYLVDADSFQFDGFLCMAYTMRFVDPLLCDPNDSCPILVKPHTPESDWYAYAVMFMRSLIFVDPYGGVYVPKDKTKRISHASRPLHRITIFDPEVRYPKPATPYVVLPDDLLQFFHQQFEKDERGEFPLILLEKLRWTKCRLCGTEHARSVCPICATVTPVLERKVTIIRGQVTATRIFSTPGLIVFAAVQGGKLRYLYCEDDQLKREDDLLVAKIQLDPHFRFRIKGKDTLIAKGRQMYAFSSDRLEPEKTVIDTFGTLPMFDANKEHGYWLQNGRLMRDNRFGPERIGDVLEGQTLFWVGEKFGFGIYRAGGLSVAFVFDAERRGINDSVELSPIRGQLVDSTCFFANERCWFIVSMRDGAKTVNQCSVILANGRIEATAETEEGDGSWLGTVRGKCAVGNFLLAATDNGLVRLEVVNGRIEITKEFPDTEPFVNSGVHLFPSQDGLYVVDRKEVRLLTLQ